MRPDQETRAALVFDYDGVLADTEPLHWKSWAALLSRYNFEYSWEDYCGFGRGVHDAQLWEGLRRRVPLPPFSELSHLGLERKRLVFEWSLAECPIRQSTIDLMTTLERHHVGLVTSSERPDVEPILRAAGIYAKFDAMVFGGDVTAPKPAPEPYLLIAQRLGVHTGIAFEDSASGIQSATAAGFEAIRIEQPEKLSESVARCLHSR